MDLANRPGAAKKQFLDRHFEASIFFTKSLILIGFAPLRTRVHLVLKNSNKNSSAGGLRIQFGKPHKAGAALESESRPEFDFESRTRRARL